MDKKKKIIIGSVVAVALLAVVIGFGVSSNKNDEGENNTGITDENNNISSEESNKLNEEIDKIESENKVTVEEFEVGLKDLGYILFIDKKYDYFLEDTSIVLVEILDNDVRFVFNEVAYIDNEKVVEAIKLLLPTKIDELYDNLKGDIQEKSLSLDNRTVKIIKKDNSIILEISK